MACMLELLVSLDRRVHRMFGWQEVPTSEDGNKQVQRALTLINITKVGLLIVFAALAALMAWTAATTTFKSKAPVEPEPAENATELRQHKFFVPDAEYPYREPIGGVFSCDKSLLEPSTSPPKSPHRVRPADIGIIAALGDSVTAGAYSDNNEKDRGTDWIFPGNSFVMGGDGALDTHLTLANIFRHLNPSLTGFSTGKGINGTNAHLNVAYPGKKSADLVQQVELLVSRIKEIKGYEKKWKLVNVFIGTNELKAACFGEEEVVPRDEYKENLKASMRVLKKSLKRVLVNFIGVWNLRFAILAQEIVYGVKKCVRDFHYDNQDMPMLYRKAMQEIRDTPEFTTPNFAITVQRIFDIKDEPARIGTEYNKAFYARDAFHLSKYGNSIVARELWKSMLTEDFFKFRIADFNNDSTQLACPDKACPYIRTAVNSNKCGDRS